MSSSSRTPSNTGVATGVRGSTLTPSSGRRSAHSWPASRAAEASHPREATQPRCSSRTWPTFMRLGTPSGLRMTSIGVPSARKGMSSTGRILEMTPLLP